MHDRATSAVTTDASQAAAPVPSADTPVQALAGDAAAYLRASAEASAALAATPGVAAVERAAALVADRLLAGGQVLFCGNGGSAADAQHLAAELMGRLVRERPAYRALALTTDTSVLTAIGNDYAYDEVFARQVQGIARPGDVLVAITTSGGSRNVLRAADAARAAGAHVVALVGPGPSPLDESADVALHCPGGVAGIVQQGHITVGHALCGIVERVLATAGERA